MSEKGLTSLPSIDLTNVRVLDLFNNYLLTISDDFLGELLERKILIDARANLIPADGCYLFTGDKYAIMGYEVITVNELPVKEDLQDYINYERLTNLGVILNKNEFEDKKEYWIRIINAYPNHMIVMRDLCDKDPLIDKKYNAISRVKLKKFEIIL